MICIKSRQAEAYSVFGCVSEGLAAMGTCCTAEGGREQEGKRKKNFWL